MGKVKEMVVGEFEPDFDVDVDGEEMPAIAYIAGPMGNFTKALSVAPFAARLEGYLVSDGWLVYNPYGSCMCERNFTEVEKDRWLENDYYWIAQCDVVVLLPGWEFSKGARLELQFALTLDEPPEIMEWVNLKCPDELPQLEPVDQARLRINKGGSA